MGGFVCYSILCEVRPHPKTIEGALYMLVGVVGGLRLDARELVFLFLRGTGGGAEWLKGAASCVYIVCAQVTSSSGVGGCVGKVWSLLGKKCW